MRLTSTCVTCRNSFSHTYIRELHWHPQNPILFWHIYNGTIWYMFWYLLHSTGNYYTALCKQLYTVRTNTDQQCTECTDQLTSTVLYCWPPTRYIYLQVLSKCTNLETINVYPPPTVVIHFKFHKIKCLPLIRFLFFTTKAHILD